MTPILAGLLDGIVQWITDAGITVINLLIAGLGATLGAAIGLLPSMPASIAPGAGSWLGWLNWFLPIAPLLAGLSVFVGLWVGFLVVKVILTKLGAT